MHSPDLFFVDLTGTAYYDSSSAVYAPPLFTEPSAHYNIEIGASPGIGGIADIQIGLLAVWDATLVGPTNVALLQAFYNAGAGVGQYAAR